MPVKIRLQRHGRKARPFYWIVAADSRSKRDGKLLEKLGTYNPTTNPATVELNIDAAVKWLQNGAQPTDTARTLLSYKGAMLKNHLAVGVRKGALTEEQAEEKFKAWLEEKDAKISGKSDQLAKDAGKAKADRLAAEKEVNDARVKAAADAEAEAKAEEEKVAADAAAEETASNEEE